jgi:hypothetical protein
MARKPQPEAPKVRRIVDKQFAKRLERACDLHPHTAANVHGRQAWLRRELEKRGHKVSAEGVRKWFHGEAKPKDAMLHQIAAILSTDAVWLRMGVSQDFSPKEQRARNALADGTVNVVAGLIQMNGGVPAFDAKDEGVDLTAIIAGKTHHIHVASIQIAADGEAFTCSVPHNHADLTVIGVAMRGSVRFDLLKFDSEVVELVGKPRGGWVELEVVREGSEYYAEDYVLPRIKNLKKPL